MENDVIIKPYLDNYDCIHDHLQYFNLRLVKALAKKDNNDSKNLYISKEQVWKIIENLDKPASSANHQLNQGVEKAWEIIQKRIDATIEKKIEFNFIKLHSLFDLGHDEILIILMLLAEKINSQYQTIYSYLQDDVSKKTPFMDMVFDIIAENTKEILDKYVYFSPCSQVVKHKIIRLEDKQLFLDEKFKLWLLGINSIDPDIKNFTQIQKITRDSFPPHTTTLIKKVLSKKQKYIFTLYGQKECEKLRSVVNLKRVGKKNILIVFTSQIMLQNNMELLLSKLFREALLQNAFLFFTDADNITKTIEPKRFLFLHCLKENLRIYKESIFISTEDIWGFEESWGKKYLWQAYHVDVPDVESRQEIWKRFANHLATNKVSYLAKKYCFTYKQIKECCSKFYDNCDIASICNDQLPPVDSQYLQKIQIVHHWKDISLTKSKKNQLKEICHCITNQDKVLIEWDLKSKYPERQGVNIAFNGDPGTGKTMAASIIAKRVKMNLYKVDISMIINKYIGETEKRLKKIFDEAANSNNILFFDEADAIFGKRGEVNEAKDHYANITVSYLLQKIEEHKGVIILATNFSDNLDKAFARRMNFVVDFSIPSKKERHQIWEKAFPTKIPIEKIDYEFLAEKIKLSGGHLKNISWLACFYAAQKKEKLSISHVIKATEREYQKIGKPFIHSDFEIH